MSEIEKHESIVETLSALHARFGDSLAFEDNWEADLMAVGVIKRGSPRTLVYFSTFGRRAGRYDVSLELPPAQGSDLPYEQGETYEDVEFEALVAIVSQHLGLARRDATS